MDGKRKNLIIGGIILMLGGLLGLVLPSLYSSIVEDDLPVPTREVLAVQPELPTFEFVGDGRELSATPLPQAVLKNDRNKTEIADHLIISSIKVEMPVFLGDTEKTLNKGGWLFPHVILVCFAGLLAFIKLKKPHEKKTR